MRRRICLAGVLAVSASPLAIGIAPATAAKSKPKTPKSTPTTPTTNGVTVTCTTNVGIMIDSGDTGVLPPVQQGTEYGTVKCGKLLGQGVQADAFTVSPITGNTQAHYTLFFHTGSVHGTYTLVPQEAELNFLEVDYLGKLTLGGGTGAYRGLKGTGKMTCQSLDGIHTTCKLELGLPKGALSG